MTLLQLQNAFNWELVYSETIEAQAAGNGRYIPIAPFELPITLDRFTLAVKTFNQDAPARWFLGARLIQVVSVPSQLQNLVEAGRLNARINRTTLLQFSKLTTDYRLKVEIPYWLQKLNIVIWQYMGPEGEALSQLDRIEGKIDTYTP